MEELRLDGGAVGEPLGGVATGLGLLGVGEDEVLLSLPALLNPNDLNFAFMKSICGDRKTNKKGRERKWEMGRGVGRVA